MKKPTGGRKRAANTSAALKAKPASPRSAPKRPLPRYELRLYVAGMTPRSARAIANIKEVCSEFLMGRYRLEVIDLFLRPDLAHHEQIIAVPTLIRRLPPPLRRMIGDLSDRERVLIGLELMPSR
jgi:circadian clock protein KaiB